jgi:hypothetical protein
MECTWDPIVTSVEETKLKGRSECKQYMLKLKVVKCPFDRGKRLCFFTVEFS